MMNFTETVSNQDTQIAHLISRIAQLEAERRWVPVSERLPEMAGAYLCHIGATYGMTWISVRKFIKGKWKGLGAENVTHWMPLPQPPEAGDE